MSEQESDMQRLEKALESLSEHFDSCQIFVTRHESGTLDGTVNVNLGVGNWYARYGQVHEWLIKQDEMARVKARRDDASSD
ncbi:MAG: hypothetical protein ACTS5I_07570 [Rhodanobacter sp.]